MAVVTLLKEVTIRARQVADFGQLCTYKELTVNHLRGDKSHNREIHSPAAMDFSGRFSNESVLYWVERQLS